jgi:hypothetical protein
MGKSTAEDITAHPSQLHPRLPRGDQTCASRQIKGFGQLPVTKRPLESSLDTQSGEVFDFRTKSRCLRAAAQKHREATAVVMR